MRRRPNATRLQEQLRRRMEVADVADSSMRTWRRFPRGVTRKEVARTLKKMARPPREESRRSNRDRTLAPVSKTVLRKGAPTARSELLLYGHRGFSYGLEIASDPTQADGPASASPSAKKPGLPAPFPNRNCAGSFCRKLEAGERPFLRSGNYADFGGRWDSGRFGVGYRPP